METSSYIDLIEFIVSKLKDIGASEVINDINQAISKRIPQVDEINYKDKNNKEYSNISKQKLRDLTEKEKFSTTIEILENYIKTTPKIFKRITELYNAPIESIKWYHDNSIKFSELEYKDNIELVSYEKDDEWNEIERIFALLKSFDGKGEK